MTNRIHSYKTLRFVITLLLTALLSACATSSLDRRYEENFDEAREKQALLTVKESYLKGDDTKSTTTVVEDNGKSNQIAKGGFSKLESMGRQDVIFSSYKLEEKFSSTQMVSVAANNMPLQDYVHYVFGELLGVNYLLTPEVSGSNAPVTLNVVNEISKRKLFSLSHTVLSDRKLTVKFNGDVYVISVANPNEKSSKTVGVGRTVDSIPDGTNNILQIVPILYGIKVSLKSTIEQLSDVTVTLDVRQSAVFLNGSAENIARALELIQLLDSPANRGRHIGMVKLQFSTIDLYLSQMSRLLETEGIPNAINDPSSKNLVFVPLYQIGAVAIFAASETLLERVEYWTKTLDQPSQGDVKQYYIFQPNYARAIDIGESLTPLIAGSQATKVKSSASASAADSASGSGQLVDSSRTQGASNDELTFVVDERTNSIIFYTSGTKYKELLPLISNLDVLPKQVMLQITIAEVTLTDKFEFGLDFALNSGKFEASSSFGAAEIAGAGLKWVSGLNNATLRAVATDNLVNILSNPSLLVRDGVTANIEVGTEIPVVGATSNTGDVVTRSVSYRQTGVIVSVTPTINAQGVVIMNITQSNSNEVDGGRIVDGNAQIFTRKLTTEVVAESGQTIIMGGLISENVTDNDSGIPGFRDIPLIGNLFGSTSQEKVKTELVIMVTPRVISRSDQWKGLMDVFKDNIDNIRID